MADQHSQQTGFNDEFEEPPVGPIGLHRGKRSGWSRALPYLITLLVAVCLGLGTWLYISGNGARLLGLGGASSSSSATSASSRKPSSSSKKTGSKSEKGDSTQKEGATDSASTGASADSQDSQKSGDSAKSSKDDQTSQDQQDQQDQKNDQNQQNGTVDRSTSVVVFNALPPSYGTARNGYAASQSAILQRAGYSHVTAQTRTGYRPSANEVWYSDDASQATAQDVAKQMGISSVRKVSGMTAKIEVLLVTK